jgi:transposase
MEACASAHHWGQALIELGYEVRLIPPAHVKPYVRRNKSDQVDAAPIYEAMNRPGQRFVPVRSIDNLAELMRHRARELLAGQRHGGLNALRWDLAEIGVVPPQGVRHAYDLKRLAGDGFDENGEMAVEACDRPKRGDHWATLTSQFCSNEGVLAIILNRVDARNRSESVIPASTVWDGLRPGC